MKNWQKVGENKYSFTIDDNEIGVMEIANDSWDMKALVKIGSYEIIIRRTGFWKTSIEIINGNNTIIAEVHPEKWYSNSFTLNYKEKKYTLITRNNPLAEWAIIENNNDLLSYELNSDIANGLVNIKISTSENNQDYIFDLLLWYLFVPMSTKNADNSLILLMMATSGG